MDKSSLQVVSYTPVHEVAEARARNIVASSKKFPDVSGIEKFIAEQAVHFGLTNQNVAGLHQEIQSHPELAGLEEDKLRKVILNAFQQKATPEPVAGVSYLASAYRNEKPNLTVAINDILAAKTHVEISHVVQEGVSPESRKFFQNNVKKSIAAENAAAAQGASSARGASRRANAGGGFTHRLAEVSTEQKVNSGIWRWQGLHSVCWVPLVPPNIA